MAKAVGIDLGTTNSVIAAYIDGQPQVIPNAEGSRTTPSVVAFTETGERLVGQMARRQAVLNPKGTIYSAKRFIGRKYDEVTEEAKVVSFDVVPGPDGAVRFRVHGRLIAPEEVSAAILRKLADDAGKQLGERVTEAVVTVPAYFNDAQRQATKDAGRIAGLNVLRIINEPTAAALAYGLDKREHETVLVYDFGGGTFDVSILDVGDGVIEVRATAGDSHLGGDDFDRRLVDFIADQFKRDTGIDLRNDPQALQRLLEAAERAKVELSSVTQTQVNLPFITADATGPKHLTTSITRAQFEELTRDLVERTQGPVQQALQDARVSADDIDEVILVGGTTRIPAVQALVRRLTGGKDPNMSVNPDEVVAVGAAIQAAVLKGEIKDVVLLDVTPLSLGLETLGGLMTRLIERNTTIPTRRAETFSTAEDNQPAVDVVVLQGERERAADNRVLGRMRLENIRPAPRGVPQIEVTFDVDANGILNVHARDRDTNAEQTITITESGTLDEAEVQRMVNEAERNRAEDQRVRQQIDARNELDSAAYQVERLMRDIGDRAPSNEVARARMLVDEARQAVKEDAPLDRMRQLTSDLQQIAQSLSSAAAAAGAGAGAPGGPGAGGPGGPGAGGPGGPGAGAPAGAPAGAAGGDEVIDAEFTTGGS
jgi:molecular chaperone DnaK